MKIINPYTFLSSVAFIFLLISPAKAQDSSKTDDSEIQQRLENVAEETQSEDADYSDLLAGLIYYKEHPINLNKTNKEELQALLLLNDIQINNLLTHLEKYGKLITIYELQTIDGFDLQTIRRLLPYIKVADNFSSAHFNLNEMFKNGQTDIVLRYGRVLEKQKGFTPIDSASLYKSPNSRYIGSPDKLYARYRFTYGTNVSWGITAEKDEGELFFKKNQKFKYNWYENSLNGNQKSGFDFYSAHLFLHNIKFVKSLAIGDYQVNFGQGLTLFSGQAFGKTPDGMSAKKSAQGISPYTSVDENKFMRGAATTLKFKRLEATAFYSRKHIDANVSDTLADGEAAVVSALQTTGLHTIQSEIADKHSILQTIYGGNLSYKGKKLDAGLTALSYNLNSDFNRKLSYYSQFEYSAKQNINVGLDYNFIIHNFNFFGEESVSKNGGKAFLNGALISLDPRLTLTVLNRNYQRNFQNLLSAGFAEGTSTSNEKGTYMGIVVKPTNTTTITAYYDRFQFGWLKYQIDAPSYGNDYVVQFNYTPSKKLDMYIRIRERDKQKNTNSTDATINYLVPVDQNNYRFNISYTILPSVKLKNRVELLDYKLGDNKTSKGYLVYQDITYNKLGNPFSCTLGYAEFQTDTYDARIYAYENDVPGSYSIPAYYGRGSRFYAMLDYNITHKIEVWIRFAQTYYDNATVISPGTLNEIDGHTKSDIKVQLKFKF